MTLPQFLKSMYNLKYTQQIKGPQRLIIFLQNHMYITPYGR